MIRTLYNWVMKWAEHPHGLKVLAFVAFIESAFFLIPPDPLQIAISLRKPKKAFYYAALVTGFSVLGGCLGYLIGMTLWELTKDFFFSYIFSEELFQKVALKYTENAMMALFIAGFTPVPYKVFTIVAGATGVALTPFLVGSFIGRGSRYFLLAALIYFFGETLREQLEKHLERIAIAATIVILLFLAIYKW